MNFQPVCNGPHGHVFVHVFVLQQDHYMKCLTLLTRATYWTNVPYIMPPGAWSRDSSLPLQYITLFPHPLSQDLEQERWGLISVMFSFSFCMANNTLLVLLGEAFSSLLCFISASFFISGKGCRHIGEIRLSLVWASNPCLWNGSPVARWACLSQLFTSTGAQISVLKHETKPG